LLSAALRTETGGSIDGRRLRIVNATTVPSPGAAALWRLHADYDLSKGRFLDFTLTDHHAHESLARFSPAPGDIVAADRYYAKARQLHHVAATGADFIVRRGLTGCTVFDEGGRKLNGKQVLAAARCAGTLDIPVLVPPPPGSNAEQRRARKRARKQAQAITPKRLQTAQALTSLDRQNADTVLRLRWQIEIALKRLKSLARLADL